jgi:purine-binding chemotaxis protein CheW
MRTPGVRCILKKGSQACVRFMSNLSDWDSIWERFAWSEAEDEEVVLRKRLQQRAQQYAAPTRDLDVAAADSKTVLTFELGEEHYGVDVMTVHGVRTIPRITRVPGTPSFYRGVVNVRGQVITVLDLRLFFDIPVGDEQVAPDELVVVRSGELEIGLLADNIEGVATIPVSEFESVDNIRYAFGVTSEKLVLLDVQRMLEDEQLVIGGHEESELRG